MNKLEIFDKIARENMEYWSLAEFKKTHPTLFNVILKAMDTVQTMAQTTYFKYPGFETKYDSKTNTFHLKWINK